MKNTKKIILASILGIALCVGLTTTLAYFTDNKTQENTITMGNVSIELREPEFEKNENNHLLGVIPNQTIVKDPTITVADDSVDSYVRLRVSYEGLTNTQIEEFANGIQLEDGWKIVGEYIYYNQVVKAKDEVKAFHEVVIPNWGNEIASKTFKMNIIAEAVQADYFTPTQENGFIIEWPGVSIES